MTWGHTSIPTHRERAHVSSESRFINSFIIKQLYYHKELATGVINSNPIRRNVTPARTLSDIERYDERDRNRLRPHFDIGSQGTRTLVSNPTRTFVCAANCLYFLCSLGNLSAASLLARDGEACAARPGLVATAENSLNLCSIYVTDTWSGRVGEAKYKRRDANDNKRGCKVKHAKCEMRGAKCEVRNGSSDCNCECGCDAFLYPSPTFLISSFFPSPTSVSPSQLGALRNAPGDVRMATLLGVLRIAHGDVRMATQLGLG